MVDTRLGGYRLVGVLGRGSFGTVYLGIDPRDGQRVAVKVLDAGDRTRDQLRAEIRAEAAALQHVHDENCVRVRDVLDTDEAIALVTDYVEGATLRAVLDRAGRLDGPQALSVLRGCLRGLVAVHASGLVHGDLKPGNVLVDARGVSRLIDFGLARPAASHVAGSSGGSPAYLSPEQIRGAAGDTRSDVYAAAVMLFELLAGTRPYRGDGVDDVLRQHVEASVPDLRTVVPDVGDALAQLCRDGMAKDPEARPASAAAFLAALEDAARRRYGAGLAWGAAGAALGSVVAAVTPTATAAAPIAGAVGAGTAAAGTTSIGGGASATSTSVGVHATRAKIAAGVLHGKAGLAAVTTAVVVAAAAIVVVVATTGNDKPKPQARATSTSAPPPAAPTPVTSTSAAPTPTTAAPTTHAIDYAPFCRVEKQIAREDKGDSPETGLRKGAGRMTRLIAVAPPDIVPALKRERIAFNEVVRSLSGQSQSGATVGLAQIEKDEKALNTYIKKHC